MNSPDTFGDTITPSKPQQKAVYDEIKALREGRAARVPYMDDLPARGKDLREVIQQGQDILSKNENDLNSSTDSLDKIESARISFLSFLTAKLTRGQKIQEGLRKIAESGAPPPLMASSAEEFDKLEEKVNDRTKLLAELKQKISHFQDLDSAKNSDDIQLLMKNAFKNGELSFSGDSPNHGKEFRLAKEDGTIDYITISELLKAFFNYESAQINNYTTLTDSDRHVIDDAIDKLSALAAQSGEKFWNSRPEIIQNTNIDLYSPQIEKYRTVMQSIRELLPYFEFINEGYKNYMSSLYETFDIKQLPKNDSGFKL